MLEAMASGLPIVVSDKVGCARDLVHQNESGFVIPVGDVNQWSLAMTKLLHDADLRERMGKRARELAEQWDYEFCSVQLQKALQVALSGECT